MISCYETGLPYCLDPHTLNTLGPDDLGGQLKLRTLAAHFRLDMENDVSIFCVVCVCVCAHARTHAVCIHMCNYFYYIILYLLHYTTETGVYQC